MQRSAKSLILVLGASGKTGTRVARILSEHGLAVRAARRDPQVRFDWNDKVTFAPVLDGVTGVYLVSPVLRVDFAADVSAFLDQAERAGVGHVTYLSGYGVERSPAEVALRAVELDLGSRSTFTHSIIRPAWFMEDFSETFLKPVADQIVVPNGDGREAFVAVEDIVAVAAATLREPGRHAGKAYAPTGPEALTVAEAAVIISTSIGRTITYRDTDRERWVRAMMASGIPETYGDVLRTLTSTIADGHGSTPTDDVLTVTGSAPIAFAEFAARAASAWTTETVR
ncbi:NmrA family NAD(P)-binding protein [Actinoplanes sp. NPDC051494]|uniref:NmrA family NAD(P)-binding protein n=1 Tax=Actinoplanes sp. NPDC051494 TaxID=3363907 RepID=UPI003792C886